MTGEGGSTPPSPADQSSTLRRLIARRRRPADMETIRCRSTSERIQRPIGQRPSLAGVHDRRGGTRMAHHYSGPDFSFPHGDPRVDHCDLFAFPSPDATSRSVLVIDVHPSFGINPPGPTTKEPFSPDAVYELKVDTNGD